MKNIFIISIISLFIYPISNTLLAQEKSFDDFRGLEWGQSLLSENMAEIRDSLVEFTLQKKESGKSYYTIENEDLTIGTADLDLIYYIFNSKGEFCALEIIGKPESNEDMTYILKNKFGHSPLFIKNSEVKYRRWKTSDGISIYFYENENEDYIVSIKNKSSDSDFQEINENVTDF